MNSTASQQPRNSISSSTDCGTTVTDPRFSCNICFEDVSDPVVTQCGHLYCWGCLFRWIEPGLTVVERQALQLPTPSLALPPVDPSHRVCPVCKSSCSVTSIIPLYVRNTNEQPQQSSSSSSPSTTRTPETTTTATTSTTTTNAVQHENDSSQPQPIDESTMNAVLDSPVAPLPEDDYSPSSPEMANLGLRQRLRFRGAGSGSQSNNPPRSSSNTTTSTASTPVHQNQGLEVPARPVPQRRRSLSENAVGHLQQQQQQQQQTVDPNMDRTFAVSQGLALTIHRALGPAAAATTATTIPPLHRREGHGSAARAASQALDETDPDATEFLSRILLMLGSFVVLCLLLF